MEFEVNLSYQKTPFGVKEFLILKSNTESNTKKNSQRGRYFINRLDKDILEGFLR